MKGGRARHTGNCAARIILTGKNTLRREISGSRDKKQAKVMKNGNEKSEMSMTMRKTDGKRKRRTDGPKKKARVPRRSSFLNPVLQRGGGTEGTSKADEKMSAGAARDHYSQTAEARPTAHGEEGTVTAGHPGEGGA